MNKSNNKNQINQENIQKVLDWAYDSSINGLPKMSNAIELAESYMKKHDSVDKAVNSLIRYQNTKATTSGFLSGLGGLIVLPIAVPANIASILYVQMRMVAAIAHMRGFDVKDDQVKTFVFVALTGHSAGNILKGTGIQIGKKIFEHTIKINVSGTVLTKINQKVGFRLVTKFGSKGIINLGKLVPVVGGVIGGSYDLLSTNVIGKTAKNIFLAD